MWHHLKLLRQLIIKTINHVQKLHGLGCSQIT